MKNQSEIMDDLLKLGNTYKRTYQFYQDFLFAFNQNDFILFQETLKQGKMDPLGESIIKLKSSNESLLGFAVFLPSKSEFSFPVIPFKNKKMLSNGSLESIRYVTLILYRISGPPTPFDEEPKPQKSLQTKV